MREGKVKPEFKYVGTHTNFDVRTESRFNCRYRLVTGGNKTESTSSITYSSIVTRESVILEFLTDGQNYIDICARDIGNAYLNATCQEKLWTEAGL